jgi:phosphatidylserine/phosphatidylglycerophosphate/cardiolipin synthase-like enzyme
MLGTFHAKFMVVDRRIALVQSDNIQDNDNMEMCVQLEGPIVDSIYDTAITTWNDPLVPPLPLLSSSATDTQPPTFQLGNHGSLFHANGSQVKTYR